MATCSLNLKAYICMNNAIVMSLNFEARKNQQAAMITAGVAGIIVLLFIFWKWELPVFPKEIQEPGIEVQLNLPDEPLADVSAGGGGGGGNPVQATGPAGAAPASVSPGTTEDSKDIEEDKNSDAPPILKPDVPKPTATKINENKSVTKTVPKAVVETPAPPRPKAVLGKTITGNGQGGGAADNYDRAGGSGRGNGVGTGDGNGGGSGNGNGGGNGTGTGRGTGPQVTRGDRRIVSTYNFQGDLEKATIYADIKVAQNGSGVFMQFAKGSTNTSSSYRTAIIQYLRNIKFDVADHESTVTVKFNFIVN